MYRLFNLLYDPRVLSVIALVVFMMFLYEKLPFNYFLLAASILVVAGALAGLLFYRHKQKKLSQQDSLVDAIQEDTHAREADENGKAELQEMRQQMNDAIKTIRKSKLGDRTGRAALYELPWYMIIGNPAAGKSSAILHSGLQFPFMEKQDKISIQGVGGTRNCDWFFSTEGILLDTAGRYSVYEEDHKEWLGFLNLLKKNRPRAPINGIIIAISIAEITNNDPEHTITLAKNLRTRVQDLTEQLEVFAPVYVIFTKMDLISGFREFFDDYTQEEREQVWGATIPYHENPEEMNITEQFEEQFDILSDGLKDLSTSRLALRHEQTVSPSLMTFPMEFQSIRPVLRTLIYALFEDNPFQFKPILRGFYFTSSLQEGSLTSKLTQEMVRSFDLSKPQQMDLTQGQHPNQSYFLKNLFSRVILKDKHLVKQHTNRKKRQYRYAVFAAAGLAFTTLLALWAWSYTNNKELVARVEADLKQVESLQQVSSGSLKTQLDSLEILQQRLEQLSGYERDLPLSLGLGLYQGDRLKAHLEKEYFDGLRTVMLQPVQDRLTRYLKQVNVNASQLKSKSVLDDKSQPEQFVKYVEASPTDAEDAYNALKTYLMLSDRSHMERGHLNDQITKFWRQWLEANRGQMPRAEMMRSAERILGYSLSSIQSPDFPLMQANLALVDETRENLTKVVKGMPAQERVYSELKMRASARYPSVTVAQVVGDQYAGVVSGSHVVSGTFTRKAWEDYVSKAIDDAATSQVVGDDWVLKSSQRNDLTLTGSPEQIRKQLVSQYKKEYVQEWQRFLSSVHVKEVDSFADQVGLLNALADTENSPIKKLFSVVDYQTSWDNVKTGKKGADGKRSSFMNWFKRAVLRQMPGEIQRAEAEVSSSGVSLGGSAASMKAKDMSQGEVARAFEAVNNLMLKREDNNNQSLIDNYIGNLSEVRSRFNKINSVDDIGPDALMFASETLSKKGSELSRSLQLVDEQIIAGTKKDMRDRLRPLLTTPLTSSFSMLLKPAKQEINNIWKAQVYTPFNNSLANKYPFNRQARIEATPSEIGKYIGQDGEIANFVDTTLKPFIIRRGDQISTKVWNKIGLGLAPSFVSDFPRYYTNYTGSGRSSGGSSSTATNKTTFQLMPLPVGGLTEYTVVIDGQQLRYRMGTQAWTTFVWPNPSSQPGASIRAKNFDGKEVTVFEEPGSFGVEKFMSSADRVDQGNGVFEMKWTGNGVTVPMRFRIVSSSAPNQSSSGESKNVLTGLSLPQEVIGRGVTLSQETTQSQGAGKTDSSDAQQETQQRQDSGTVSNTNSNNNSVINNPVSNSPLSNGSEQTQPDDTSSMDNEAGSV